MAGSTNKCKSDFLNHIVTKIKMIGYKYSSLGIISLTALACYLLTPLAQAKVFDPATFQLDNGMQVFLIENHRSPVVSHMILYKVGSIDEEPGQSGIAHFLEHLMFKGTPRFPNGLFSQLVARNGGQENAFTSYDYTGYYQVISRDHLEIVMDMEADRMKNLSITELEVETERNVVLEERRTRVDRNPRAILHEQANASLYVNHPYRRPIIGWEHEILSLDHIKIMKFYRRWYMPNNALLIIAGDITINELRPLVEKYYATIPSGKLPPRLHPSEPKSLVSKLLTYRSENVMQPLWGRLYNAPSRMTGKTDHTYALEILSDIFGGDTTSYLYRELVLNQKLAVNAGAYYNPNRLGPSQFSIYASPLPGVTVQHIESAINDIIATFLSDGILEEEIYRSINAKIAGAAFARDSIKTASQILGSLLASGQTLTDIENWPHKISKVDLNAVTAAAQHIFLNGNFITTHLLDKN